MRITGGQARGIQLRSPSNNHTRPATDYLREALYSSLGTLVSNTRVLDLYAGTGSYGLEALSRGASHITFIEKNRHVLKHLIHNIAETCKSLGIEDSGSRTKAIALDALKWKCPLSNRYDIIIADPPYAILTKQYSDIIQHGLNLLSDESYATFILEAPGGFSIESLPDSCIIDKRIERSKNQPSAVLIKKKRGML